MTNVGMNEFYDYVMRQGDRCVAIDRIKSRENLNACRYSCIILNNDWYYQKVRISYNDLFLDRTEYPLNMHFQSKSIWSNGIRIEFGDYS